MSEIAASSSSDQSTAAGSGLLADAHSSAGAGAPVATGSFFNHAGIIATVTFISRLLGLAREIITTNYFGAGVVWSAWKMAFTIPNLFRKLLGEGALSAAFIPLYVQARKKEQAAIADHPAAGAPSLAMNNAGKTAAESATDFANASVSFQVFILIGLTIVGELVLAGLYSFADLRPDYLLGIKLTLIMLPYVTLVCVAALLGGILNVHHRFTAAAATAIVSNVCLIVAIILIARAVDLRTEAGQKTGAIWLSWAVLVAGVAQIAMLMPSLRAIRFRFRPVLHFWTPAVRRMMMMAGPAALSAGVMQVGVLVDKGIGFVLARGADPTLTHFSFLGLFQAPYPMAAGAAARLDLAQFMYQFPLSIFATALATAIFPRLSRDTTISSGNHPALTAGHDFKRILRQGIEASFFIGLPASVGMVLVAQPAIALLFLRGQFTAFDADWVARSTAIYSAAIWAFSLLQILNRAYYALRDMVTPLIWGIVNLLINVAIELPLIWTGLGESGIAVGTFVSFSVQSLVMLWILNRRIGGMNLRHSIAPIVKMIIATGVMTLACLGVSHLPFYPQGSDQWSLLVRLLTLMSVGGLSYFAVCLLLGIQVMRHLTRR